MKLNIAVMASVLVLSGAAVASTNDGAPAPTGSFQCLSFVRTARPGVNYTFPLGAPMADLASARQDAYTRCATDAQARAWSMLCQVSCIRN